MNCINSSKDESNQAFLKSHIPRHRGLYFCLTLGRTRKVITPPAYKGGEGLREPSWVFDTPQCFETILPLVESLRFSLQIFISKKFLMSWQHLFFLFVIIVLWIHTHTVRCFHFRGKKYCEMMLKINWSVKTTLHRPSIGAAPSGLWIPDSVYNPVTWFRLTRTLHL